MSAWVMVCVARQLIVQPGASDEPLTGVHVPSVARVSVLVPAAFVLFLSFVGTIGERLSCPTRRSSDLVATLVMARCGFLVPGVVTSAQASVAPLALTHALL